jgi:hypothetical protein
MKGTVRLAPFTEPEEAVLELAPEARAELVGVERGAHPGQHGEHPRQHEKIFD